jgi:hypothetical protein
VGFQTKSTTKKVCIQKRVKRILKNLDYDDCTVLVQEDESIFVYDYLIRKKKWISKDKRPVVKVTGSRNKTIIFGCLSIEGKQLFRQYKKFDSSIFVDYLKHVKNRFGKFVMFVDRGQHHIVPKLQKHILMQIRILLD